jgi:hypothetical protein
MARLLILFYFFFWRLLPCITVLDFQTGHHSSLTIAIAIMAFFIEILILAPFFLRHFAGIPVGWLHPFILPTVVSVALGFLMEPVSILVPFTAWFSKTSNGNHILLQGWGEFTVLTAQLRESFINVLALISTYLGFLIYKARAPAVTHGPIRIDGFKLTVCFLFFLFVVLLFLQLQGGVIAHMATLAGGRHRMGELNGHFLVINNFLPYVIILWYAYQPKALRNPFFLLAFFVASISQFVVTGSRSALLMPLAMLLAVWILHNRRLPVIRVILLGVCMVLSIGILGEVRRSGDEGSIDISPLLESDLTTAWASLQEERAARAKGTDLAVAAIVPEKENYLYGTTYLAALAFWVPRSIWREKPRGAGAHAAALLYHGRDTMDGYRGGGYPLNGAYEAFWNYWYPGVVIVYLIFGSILGLVSRWFCRESANPYAVVGLLIVNFGLNTPNTTSLVPALQSMVLLYVLYLFVTRLRLTRNFPSKRTLCSVI